MTRSLLKTMLALAALVAALALAACGSDDDDGGGTGGTPATSEEGGGGEANATEALFEGSATANITSPDDGQKGGELTVLSGADVDYMDPGQTYYTYAIGIMNTMHRGLYAYPPGESTEPVADLADGMPEISEDGKTVTVKLKQGVMFSKPVDREVEAKDVKYAIERAFSEHVPNGYAGVYFGDLQGAPEPGVGPIKEIPGIEVTDKNTLTFKLTKGTGAALAGALAMPISIPVPEEFAAKYDESIPSTYGQKGLIYTGPYMVEGGEDGTPDGYVPGKTIKLVRNPDYTPVDDFRPAFLDAITFEAGNEDTAVASRRVLTGQGMALGDLEPPSRQLETLLENNKPQLSAVPGGGWRFISLDTSEDSPFADINVRKAVIAGFNRIAARQQRGGEALGLMSQHLIPPGMPGYEESNGPEGWASEQDWMQSPEGNRELAAEYFKKAGFASGKYEGGEEVLIVGDNADPDKSIAQITEQQLQEMGFKTKLQLVTRSTMFTKFCGDPKSGVDVCPSVGWAQDFADPQTMLDPTFNGDNIIPAGNVNWPELNVPEVNDAINQAKLETEPAARAQAWADVNKLITDQAPGIPYMWDYQASAVSENVRGVQNAYSTTWDWNFTSIVP